MYRYVYLPTGVRPVEVEATSQRVHTFSTDTPRTDTHMILLRTNQSLCIFWSLLPLSPKPAIPVVATIVPWAFSHHHKHFSHSPGLLADESFFSPSLWLLLSWLVVSFVGWLLLVDRLTFLTGTTRVESTDDHTRRFVVIIIVVPVYESIHRSIHPSVHLPQQHNETTYLRTYLPTYLRLYSSIYRYIYRSIDLAIHATRRS